MDKCKRKKENDVRFDETDFITFILNNQMPLSRYLLFKFNLNNKNLIRRFDSFNSR
jgi:hypothetical protein